ncbi:MAG TPA: pseudouridine synthase [Gammaproteobacteria bacterium]|nr:pseudouridine synthase [Gammaproteobacteria bacterium]
MSKERIQKALARQGLGSRRQIEGWIKDGLIRLNGADVELGQLVENGDTVMYNGRKIIIRDALQSLPRVLMYHKPDGEVCSRSDPQGRPTIFDKAPGLKHSRWVAVGRLDINTSGLILLTDNGDLANKLMHPSSQLQREYAVRVQGKASAEQLKKLTHGVDLEDGKARFEDIMHSGEENESTGRRGINHWYHVVLMEGRNREVRRMWEAVNLRVSRLMRVRYGSVMMKKSLRPGQYRELDAKEVRELAELAGIEYARELRSGTPMKKDFRMTKHKPATSRGRSGAPSGQGRSGGRSDSRNSSRKNMSGSAPAGSGRRKTGHEKRR